jgi:hypothetical protein
MNKLLKNIIALLITIFFSNIGFNQVNNDFSLDLWGRMSKEDMNRLSSDELSRIAEICKDHFLKYVQYGTLLDKSGENDRNPLTKFKELFVSNAKVWDDLKLKSNMVSFDDYTNSLGTFQGALGGLKYDIDSAYIKNMVLEEPYYKIKIRFDKLMYKGLENDNPIEYKKNPARFPLLMTMQIATGNMENVEIIDITCTDCARPDPERESYTGVNFSYGISGINILPSQFLSGSYTDLKGMIKGKSELAFGADYLRNLKGGENLFWNIGLRYSLLNIETKLTEKVSYNQQKSFDEVVFYNRLVDMEQGATENIEIQYISIPLGLTYRFMVGSIHTLFLGANIIPSYYIGVNYKFKGNFNRQMNIDNILISRNFSNEENSNCNGAASIPTLLYSSTPKSIKMSVELGIKYLYKYKYNQVLGINLGYRRSINPVLDAADKIFLGDNYLPVDQYKENTSLTRTLFQDIKVTNINLGISWYYIFESKGLLY